MQKRFGIKAKKSRPGKGLFLGAPCNSGSWSQNVGPFYKIFRTWKYQSILSSTSIDNSPPPRPARVLEGSFKFNWNVCTNYVQCAYVNQLGRISEVENYFSFKYDYKLKEFSTFTSQKSLCRKNFVINGF